MGLELKPAETRLTHTLNKCGEEKPGFTFLGFNIRQRKVGKYHSKQGFKTIITPSKKAAPQMALISRLNPVITGWLNYYSTVVSKEDYSKLDNLMYHKLKAWAERRHSNKTGIWVVNKYWQTIGGNNWYSQPGRRAKTRCGYGHMQKLQ